MPLKYPKTPMATLCESFMVTYGNWDDYKVNVYSVFFQDMKVNLFSSNNFITTLTLGHLYPNYSSYSYGAELYYPNVLTLIGNRFLCESLTYSTRKVVCAENGLTRKRIVSWTKF